MTDSFPTNEERHRAAGDRILARYGQINDHSRLYWQRAGRVGLFILFVALLASVMASAILGDVVARTAETVHQAQEEGGW
ncbi:hypothetical protein [Pseudogemmobacter sonorensis]|uniref:hypothetical protein n=1 Tax=Pseudogemmobacter sonorensis TaxID=2989681 RepID=UPI0036CE6696